jgi:hypothetical protein
MARYSGFRARKRGTLSLVVKRERKVSGKLQVKVTVRHRYFPTICAHVQDTAHNFGDSSQSRSYSHPHSTITTTSSLIISPTKHTITQTPNATVTATQPGRLAHRPDSGGRNAFACLDLSTNRSPKAHARSGKRLAHQPYSGGRNAFACLDLSTSRSPRAHARSTSKNLRQRASASAGARMLHLYQGQTRLNVVPTRPEQYLRLLQDDMQNMHCPHG